MEVGLINKDNTKFRFFEGYLFLKHKPVVHAETKTTVIIGERKPALPTYSMAEVAKHTTKEKGI